MDDPARTVAGPGPARAYSEQVSSLADTTATTATTTDLATAALASAAIIVVALVLIVVCRWLLNRLFKRLAKINLPELAPELGGPGVSAAVRTQERERRLETLHGLFNSVLSVAIGVIAVIMVLQAFGMEIGPLLASVGIVGAALAFGAKSLIEDIVSGLFMLIENQYNVGDRIEVGGTASIMSSGTVMEVGLRVTTIRDDDGKVWYVRNGQVLRVANESQGWALASVDLTLAPGSDVSAVRRNLEQYLQTVLADEAVAPMVAPDADPQVLLADLTSEGAQIEIRAYAQPGRAEELASALRRWLVKELDRTGVELA